MFKLYRQAGRQTDKKDYHTDRQTQEVRWTDIQRQLEIHTLIYTTLHSLFH